MNIRKNARLTAAVLLVLLGSLTGSGIASAASSASAAEPTGWAIQPLPTLTVAPNGHLSAVSCPSALSCAAVGYSHDAQGVDVTLAEKWDGSRWTIQPTPNPQWAHDSFLTGVSCMSLSACTAVGDAVTASGQQVALAERWNGRRWELQRMPSPVGTAEIFLTGVSCVAPTMCTAVGYDRSGGRTTTIAEHWDGIDWHLQATPKINGANSSRLSSVSCSAASACTAVGFSGDLFGDPQAFAERWDGISWSLQANPEPPGATRTVLSSVSCPSATFCVATGYWHDNAKGGGTLAEQWDGSAWTIEPTPGGLTATYTAVSCTSPNACLVVGKSDLSDFVTARWDGTSWTSTTAPPSATQIDTNYQGLSCGSTIDACVAVGASETARFDFTYLTLAAAWNGSSWTLQATAGPSGATANELVAVSCATERSCVAVGEQWTTPDAAQPLVEYWNGAGWKIQTTPDVPGSFLSAVSCSAANDCVAVGRYTDSSGGLAALAEHFDGTSWRVEPTPAPAGSTAAAFTGVSCTRPGGDALGRRTGSTGTCVAVGGAADAGGSEVMLAERRTGTTWAGQTLPAPDGAIASVLNAVSCLASADCTAVGAFQAGSLDQFGSPEGPCGVSCDVSEHWNGTDWQVQVPTPPPAALSDSLASVSCSAPAACMAVGQWTPQDRAGGHPGITLAEYWNGTGWAVQDTPDPPGVGGPDGSENSPFETVSCVVGAPLCTAVGNYDGNNDSFLPMAERWSRGQWTVQAMPAPLDSFYNDIRGVSCPTADMCMAVGMSYRYDVADHSPGPHLSLAELYRGRR